MIQGRGGPNFAALYLNVPLHKTGKLSLRLLLGVSRKSFSMLIKEARMGREKKSPCIRPLYLALKWDVGGSWVQFYV